VSQLAFLVCKLCLGPLLSRRVSFFENLMEVLFMILGWKMCGVCGVMVCSSGFLILAARVWYFLCVLIRSLSSMEC
jgi:hypothetical protein